MIRPERVQLEDIGDAGENRVPGMVERVVYVGSIMQVIVHLAPGQTLQAWVQNQGEGLPYGQGASGVGASARPTRSGSWSTRPGRSRRPGDAEAGRRVTPVRKSPAESIDDGQPPRRGSRDLAGR